MAAQMDVLTLTLFSVKNLFQLYTDRKTAPLKPVYMEFTYLLTK